MLSNRFFNYGPLKVSIYDFEKAGDTLEPHVHGEDDIHITIIARGELVAFTPDSERTVREGAVLDWQVGEWHGLRALTDNARIVNVVKV